MRRCPRSAQWLSSTAHDITADDPDRRRALDCPFCAHGELAVIVLEVDPVVLAVRGPECGAVGPRSTSDGPAHAVFAWNHATRCAPQKLDLGGPDGVTRLSLSYGMMSS
jgi:hypothetical protein